MTDTTEKKGNVHPISEAIENAAPEPGQEAKSGFAATGTQQEAKSGAPENPGGESEPKFNQYGLPSGCPVTPLGTCGGIYFFLDRLNQIWDLAGDKISRNNIASMFSPDTHLLKAYWPRLKKVTEKTPEGDVERWLVTGFRAEDTGDDLRDACSRLGVWRSFEKIRGAGAWLDDDKRLIFHCGDALVTLHDGKLKTRKPGSHDGMVYPTAPALPHPVIAEQEPGAPGAGLTVLNLLKSWNWARGEGDVDAYLMLGWVGCALLGGALDWRPMAFVTGDRATGKSTLHNLVGWLLGGAAIQTPNTTAAGIYQHLGQSSLALLLDELENDQDNRRQRAIMELARQSSSGGMMLRGGAEHKGVEFRARSCFLFSAIIMPPFGAQDLSRMAVLNLNELPQGAPPPKLDAKALKRMGGEIRGRLLQQWPRWPDTLQAYWQTLSAAGHSARACDQFGTLLAVVDLLLYDVLPDGDTLAAWAERLAPDKMAETAQNLSDAERCLNWLCEGQPDTWRGGAKNSVSDLVGEYVGGVDDKLTASSLATGGCACIKTRVGEQYLAVGISHRGAALIFENSNWAGMPGASGPWAQALGRLKGAKRASARIGGRSTKCVLIPVALVYQKDASRSDTASSPSSQELQDF